MKLLAVIIIILCFLWTAHEALSKVKPCHIGHAVATWHGDTLVITITGTRDACAGRRHS